MRALVLTLAVGVLGLLAVPALASAASRYVSPAGDDLTNDCTVQANPCLTITHAVSVAADDDTVNLAAGTYVESVAAGRPLSFVGPNDGWRPGDPLATPAIWRAPAAGPALNANANGVSVSGITFGTPGGGTPPSGSVGVSSNGFSNLSIDGSIFTSLVRGIALTSTVDAGLTFNEFGDNDTAIAGTGDNGTDVLFNAFSDNVVAVALDTSANPQVSDNTSAGDSGFVQMQDTNTSVVSFNQVTDAVGDAISVRDDFEPTLQFNDLSGDGDGIHVYNEGSPAANLTVEANNLADLGGAGLRLDPGSVIASELAISGNRFYDTGEAGLIAGASLGTVPAEDNWWGCNAGPNTADCDGFSAGSGTTIDADPWTVMALSADPTSIPINGATSDVTVDFNTNSNGDDITPQGLPDDVPVDFAASLGDIDTPICTCGGVGVATLTSGNTPGTSHVTATLDGQSVTTDVEFTSLLSVDPTSAAYGAQAVGTGSAARTFTITNPQSFDLPVDSITLAGDDPSDYKLFANACVGTTLPSGGTCQFSASFVPTSVGPKRAVARIASSGELIDIPLSGTGTAAAPLSLAPTSWDFGQRYVNASSPTKDFTITNSALVPVTISHVDLAGADPGSFVGYGGGCLNVTLPAGGSCTISALFRPASAGAKSADLKVSTTASLPQTIALSGTGTTTPPLTFNPTAWSFGNQAVGTASPTKTFTITNASSTTLTVTNIALAGTNAGDFVRYSGGCTNVTLAAGASCSISALFKPLTTGAKTAQLKVTSNGGPVQLIDLSGTGT